MAFPLPLLLGIDAIICSSIHITADVYAAMVYTHSNHDIQHPVIGMDQSIRKRGG